MTEIGGKKLWICNKENGDYSWKPVDGLYIIILDTVYVEIEMDRKHITKKCMCIIYVCIAYCDYRLDSDKVEKEVTYHLQPFS